MQREENIFQNSLLRIKKNNIVLEDDINQKFIEISNRKASFNEMCIDEQLAEIAKLIENMLKKNGKFLTLNYAEICLEYIDDSTVTSYRKKLHCFRHSSDETLNERKKYNENQKMFFVDYGLTIIKVIHSLL